MATKAKGKAVKQAKGKQSQKVNGEQHVRHSRKGTIEHTIMTGIGKGLSPQDNLAAVKKSHRGCKTSIACVYWYQDKARKGLVVLGK